MKNHILAASLLLLSSSATALSADLSSDVIEYDAVENINSWGGFYAGIQAGWIWSTAKDNSGFPSTDLNGATIGTFLGYNHAIDNFVVGAELDAGFSNLSKLSAGNAKIRSNWNAGLSARVGYAFDAFLPYVRVGAGLRDGYMKLNSSGLSDSNIHSYVETGVGLETKLFENISLRGELLYTQSSEESYKYTNTYKADFQNTSFRIGLSQQF